MEDGPHFQSLKQLLNTLPNALVVSMLMKAGRNSEDTAKQILRILETPPTNQRKSARNRISLVLESSELDELTKAENRKKRISLVQHPPPLESLSRPHIPQVPVRNKSKQLSKEEPTRMSIRTSKRFNYTPDTKSYDDMSTFKSSSGSKQMPIKRKSQTKQQEWKLLDILNDPTFFAAFRSFLVSKYCEEVIDFWKEVEEFKRVFKNLPYSEGYALAKKIYCEFIAESGVRSINIPSSVRFPLDDLFHKRKRHWGDDAGVTEKSFNPTQVEMVCVLASQWFPEFKADPLFAEARSKYEQISRIRGDRIGSGDTLITPLNSQLALADWDILLTNVSMCYYSEGDIIAQQNKFFPFLFRTVSGTVRYERVTESGVIVLARFSNPKTIFGFETIFRCNLRSPVRIVAETKVIAKQLNGSFILRYLQTNSTLAYRFFTEIGSLGCKLPIDPAPEDNNTPINGPISPPSPLPRTRDRSTTLLIPDLISSKLILECEATVKSGKVATLYNIALSQTALFFYITENSKTLMHQILFIHLTAYQQTSNQTIKIKAEKKRYTFKFSSEEDATTFINTLQALVEMKDGNNCNYDQVIGNIIQSIPAVTQDVWDELGNQKQASYTTYSKGDIIIQEGKIYSAIIIIFNGSIRLERPSKKGRICINLEITIEDMYGERGLLLGKPSLETVVATSRVDVLLINNSFLKRTLIEDHPNLTSKFYFQICRSLADRYAKVLDSLYK